MAKTVLLPTGEQACARRRAIRACDVALRTANPRGGESIEVGRRDIFTAMEADVGVAHVIADDEQDVWAIRCPEGDGKEESK